MTDEKDIYVYEGKDADVTWDKRLCIHIGECGRARGDLFVGGRQPWCEPDRASTNDVLDVIQRCPSGALAVRRKDGGPDEEPESENTVVVSYNGPLYVKGNLDIDGAADDMPSVKFRAALCRCGDSKNKPFCDNSHEKERFQDYGAVGEKGEPLQEKGGVLKIGRAKNGPLILSGNLSIVASSGRVAWTGTKAVLCRCGHSKNKPFCDGTHRQAGFEAE